MQVRLIHLDGKLPNLALMKLSHWHKSQGDEVSLTTSVQPSMFETRPDKVYASAIFKYSLPRLEEVRSAWPKALLGGTGTGLYNTVEQAIGKDPYEHYDYSIYPGYPWSIGFTQRGCRLNCSFCVVPKKEGKPLPANSIQDIWRPGTERKIVLLDNDFWTAETPVAGTHQGDPGWSFQGLLQPGHQYQAHRPRGSRSPGVRRVPGRPVRKAPPVHRLGQPGPGEDLLPGLGEVGAGRHTSQAHHGLHADRL